MTATETTRYIADLDRKYQTGKATEHSYRPALRRLLEETLKAKKLPKLDAIQITNEPKRIECGAPDFIATRNDIPVGYQPTQKWLKDRKLEYEDIEHYRKIVLMLRETGRVGG